MRLFALGLAVAALSSLNVVSSKEVFAHYMVGSVSQAHAEQDIDEAKAAGITGFSLNIGTPSKDFVGKTLGYLFAHAASVGGFHLHISMDIWASGDAAGGHPDLYNDLVRGYVGNVAYFKVNGKPFITTFSDGGLTNDAWAAWKLNTLQNNLYFCPDFDGTAGYTTGANDWWLYWGPVVDCVLSWDASWQKRPGIDPSTGKAFAGSLAPGSAEIDQAVLASARSRGKAYNMGISELQYKNAYSTNVYRNGGMITRMSNILSMAPDFVTLLTWNDGPESHYFGSIWSEQNTDADPARYVFAGDEWSHAGWRPLIASFAAAYKSGGGISSMTPQGSSANVIGSLWYSTILKGAPCSGPAPGGLELATDTLHWALVLKAGKDTSNYRLYLISGSTTVLVTGFKDGLNSGTTPIHPGVQRLELYDAASLIFEAKGGDDVHSDCPGGIFNMNDVVRSVVPPQTTGTTGLCTFHFTQYQKPNPASDPYTFDLTLFDPSGLELANIQKAVGRPSVPITIGSTLSASLVLFAGNVDADPVTFAYETQTWTSATTAYCKTGAYDSGNREGDCGFSCFLPVGNTCIDPGRRISYAGDVANRLTSSAWMTPQICTSSGKEGTQCSGGFFKGDQHWQSGNAYEDILNFMAVSGQTDHQSDLDSIPLMTDVSGFQDASDDAGWGVLLYIRMDDFYGTTKQQPLQDLLYTYIEGFKNTKCGGGVSWSSPSDAFKSSISTALYMHISAALAIRRPASRAAYLAKAQDTWTWLANSGIRNSDNIWQDGRRYHSDTDSCTTDVGIFLYTQGVIASGLGVLYAATKDANYLTEAEKTIDGVIRTKTLNGVLFENCDLDPNNPCDHNNQEYKGIFLKHLMYYLDQANDPARTAKYAPFLAKQSNAVRSIATNGAGDPGSLWCQAPTDALKSITSTWSVASGLAAHYVAAKYSPC